VLQELVGIELANLAHRRFGHQVHDLAAGAARAYYRNDLALKLCKQLADAHAVRGSIDVVENRPRRSNVSLRDTSSKSCPSSNRSSGREYAST
jgi:hypothetical protein